jgi:predicted nuclease of predicted toxin-antitoxin system
MKFLIDNQLPVALRSFLSREGFDAAHVLELGMECATDLEIAQFAAAEGRAIITKDEDFALLAALDRCAAPVIWIRIGNCRSDVLLKFFSESLTLVLEKLLSGEVVIEVY